MAVKVRDVSTRKCKSTGQTDGQIDGRRKVKGRMQSRSQYYENSDCHWRAKSEMLLRVRWKVNKVKQVLNTKTEHNVTVSRTSRPSTSSEDIPVGKKNEVDDCQRRGCKRKASCLDISSEVAAKVPRIIAHRKRPR